MSSWRRVPSVPAMKREFPGVRTYQRPVEDGHLTVIVTREQIDGGPWLRHLSISHRVFSETTLTIEPGRYPTWDEQREAVHRFCPGIWMESLLPPEGSEDYVNLHPTTFHWWERVTL